MNTLRGMMIALILSAVVAALVTLLINATGFVIQHWDLDTATKWAQLILALATAITLIFIGASAVYAGRQLQHIQLQRKADLHLRLYDAFRSMEADRAHVAEIHDTGKQIAADTQRNMSDPNYTSFVRLGTFFEMMALLVEERAIDQHLVDETYMPALINFVETARPLIEARHRENRHILDHLLRMYGRYKRN